MADRFQMCPLLRVNTNLPAVDTVDNHRSLPLTAHLGYVAVGSDKDSLFIPPL